MPTTADTVLKTEIMILVLLYCYEYDQLSKKLPSTFYELFLQHLSLVSWARSWLIQVLNY